MNNKKKRKPFFYYASQCLSQNVLKKYVKNRIHNKCGSYVIGLPDDLASPKNILFVLPEEPIETLYQIINIVSIQNFFSSKHNSNCIFLCEKNITPYIRDIVGILHIIEYDRDERYLFSTQLKTICNRLCAEYIDLCLVLERKPHISLLQLIGSIQAKVRVTYSEAGEFPFFNVRIKGSVDHTYLTDQNIVMAEMLGVKIQNLVCWNISETAKQEVAHILDQYSHGKQKQFGGIDALFFYTFFGKRLTENLINTLKSSNLIHWYLYAKSEQNDVFLIWVKKLNMPFFTGLSFSHNAALLFHSDLFITGKTIMFELAHLLKKPALGLFEKDELPKYCKQTDRSIGICYSDKPNDNLVNELCVKTTLLIHEREEKKHIYSV